MATILTSRQPWTRRPSGLVTPNWGSASAAGLIGWATALPCGAREHLSGTSLTPRSGTTTEPHPSQGGWAVRADANNEAYSVDTPVWLKAPWPITIAAWVQLVGTPDNAAAFAGVGHNTTAASPYVAYVLYYATTGGYQFAINNGTTFAGLSANRTYVAGELVHLIGLCGGSTGTKIYVNGVQSGSSTTARNNPAYGATSNLFLGEQYPTQNRNPNASTLEVRVYGRVLSDGEIAALVDQRTRWELYAPETRVTFFDLGAVTPTAYAASDTFAVTLTDAFVLDGSAFASDTLPVKLTEATLLDGTLAVADTLPVVLTEAIVLAGTLDTVDSFAVQVSEATVLGSTLTLAESFPVVVSEALVLAGTMDVLDTLPVTVTEALPLINGTLDVLDTLPVILSEDVRSDGTTDPSESVGIGIADVVIIDATLDALDTFAVVLAEVGTAEEWVASAIAYLFAADTLAVVLTELVFGEGTADVSDTLPVTLSEALIIDSTFAVAETWAIQLLENAYPTVEILATDALPVGMDAEAVVLLIGLTPSEALALGLMTDLLIDGTATATEALRAGVTDAAPVLLVTVEALEALPVGVGDQGYLTINLDALDTWPVVLTEQGYQALGAETIDKAGAAGAMPWDRRLWRVHPFRATIRRKV